MAQILDAVREYKQAGVRRREMVLLLARRYPWIYAPNFYEDRYHPDGTLAELRPKAAGLPARIERCCTPDFESAAVPAHPLVPWVEAVHDRIAIEIMRGCPNACRFCHAGYTRRPLRLRSVDRILELAEQAYWATGYDEIGLLSLSTADYPQLGELAKRINERFAPRMVNISFPSLRVDRMLQDIPWMASAVRKAGLTIAAEAAAADLRQALRKKVTDGDLLDGVRAAYEAGWNRVKLYFMAGFPGERAEDIDGIFELAAAVSHERKKIGKPPASVTVSLSWLVPKPFTPLQWAAQPRVAYFEQVRERLLELRRGRRCAIRINTHRPERSVLEAVLARGDRRLAPVLYEAWKRGARFDGWDDCFRPEIWTEAFSTVGVDPDFYAHRARSFEELLPWDHIGLHLPRAHLERDYEDLLARTARRQPAAPGFRA